MKVIGHEKEKVYIEKLLEKNYDSLSLLFEGVDCIGKKLFALYTARGYLCEKRESFGCGKCKDCRLMDNTISNIYEKTNLTPHPNIRVIQSEGKEIKIDQIREVIDFLSLKSDKGKVVIIEKAENMNVESGNAILKTLEEPPHKSLIILTTSNQSKILPTILSRLKKIKFAKLSREEVRQILLLKGIGENRIGPLIDISDGSMCMPFFLINDESVYKYGKDLYNLMLNPNHQEGIFSLSQSIENLETEQAIKVFDIIFTLLGRDVAEGKVEPELFEAFLKESYTGRLAILRGVKKKLVIEGFYLKIIDEVKRWKML